MEYRLRLAINGEIRQFADSLLVVAAHDLLRQFFIRHFVAAVEGGGEFREDRHGTLN